MKGAISEGHPVPNSNFYCIFSYPSTPNESIRDAGRIRRFPRLQGVQQISAFVSDPSTNQVSAALAVMLRSARVVAPASCADTPTAGRLHSSSTPNPACGGGLGSSEMDFPSEAI